MRLDELKREHEVGHMQIKIAGWINACGRHHVGHSGIVGLDRAGVENYQITLGGDATETARIGDRAGPGFSATQIVPAIERVILTYLKVRLNKHENFIHTYQRLGIAPFKQALYPKESQSPKIQKKKYAA